MIWLLTLAEYIDKALQHFRKTGDYLPEIQKLLDEIDHADDSLKEPTDENVRGLAAALHKVSVVTAWQQEKKIPDDVLEDYPWLRAEKLELLKNTYEYSFPDKTDFGTAENFREFLTSCGISTDHKICRQFPLMEDFVCYLWQGENIRMVTVKNPLREKGFAHFIVMQGEMGTVLSAAQYIQKHTGSKGDEGLYIVDFTELHCMEPDEEDDHSHGKPPDAPAGDGNPPNVYQLKQFGEFLSDHPIDEKQVKGGTADNSDSLYKLPWEMTRSEFKSHVKRYTHRFRDYPVEIWEVLGMVIQMLPEMEKVLKEKPSVKFAAELAKPVHIVHVIKALILGKTIPGKVLEDYPELHEAASKKGPISIDQWHYGFDATDFKTSENFKELLRLNGLSEKYKVCHYITLPEKPELYLWEGEDINMVTWSNPLSNNGYASFIGISGKKGKVVKVLAHIEELTGSKGDQGSAYVDFKEIRCAYPDASTKTDPSAQTDPLHSGRVPELPEITQPVTDKAEKQNDDPTSIPNVDAERSSGLSQLENIEKALDAGHSFEAASIIWSMLEKIKEGHDTELLPHIIKYKQQRDLRRDLSHLDVEDIITSEKFRLALTINLWNLIPEEYKTLRTIKPISWKADPGDKGLRLLLSDFVGHNELRRAFLGANFDARGIAATDAHKLIFLNNTHLSKKGIYCITKFCFKALGKEGAEEAIIEENFPDYLKVLPSSVEIVHTVHTEAIRIFCGTLRKAKLLSSREQTMTFCYAEQKYIGIDIEYLERCAEAFLRLGYPTVDIGFIAPNKAILITPPGKIDQVSSLTTPFILLMPSVLNSGESRGIEKGELYFDLRDEHIVTEGIEERIKLAERVQHIESAPVKPNADSKKVNEESDSLNAIPNSTRTESTLDLLSDDNWFKQHPEKIVALPEEIETLADSKLIQSKAATALKEKKPVKKIPHAEDYIDKVVAVMHDKYAKGERATKKQIEQLAVQLNVPNMGKLWEAVELSWMLWYRMLYKEPVTFEARLSKMVKFWNNLQPTYSYSDSSKELYRQYSTPCPIAAIVAEYTGMRNAQSIFEPSAGNGLLVLGADPAKTHVNEIDPTRVDSLKFQGFKKITTLNAAHPFPEELSQKYNVVVTNPPFTKWEEDRFDKDYLVRKYFHNHIGLSHYLRMEHLMAGLALHTMKDDGKAAIIIMGHIYFKEDGYIGKYRPFFNWLYRHYNVDDVINLNSFKLYNKQGAIERTMLILINGRKKKPEGVAPGKQQAPGLEEIVNTFEDLWKRVRSHMKTELDILIDQLKIALAA